MDRVRRIWRKLWRKLTEPDEFAVCDCTRCQGTKRPTCGMVRDGLDWYCCEEAHQESLQFNQVW